MEMTSRQRVLTTIAHREPDRVPVFDFLYSRKLYKEMIGRVPLTINGQDVVECARKMRYDIAVIPFGGFGGFISSKDMHTATNQVVDEWQTVYQQDESSWPSNAPVAYPLKDRADWKNYVIPEPRQKERVKELKIALSLAVEDDMAVFGSVRGPFSATWLLFGIENFSLLLYDDPSFVDEVLARCTDFSIEGATMMVEEGADAIIFADDYGTTNTTLLAPEHFKTHILPQVRRMVNALEKLGKPVIMHSDGFVRPFLPDLVGTGIAGFHPIERKAGMEIGDVKRDFGNELCLIGNVDNKGTMVHGSTHDVETEVKECIHLAARGGGYILASDHSLHDDMPLENMFAFVEAGRKFGTYPVSI